MSVEGNPDVSHGMGLLRGWLPTNTRPTEDGGQAVNAISTCRGRYPGSSILIC